MLSIFFAISLKPAVPPSWQIFEICSFLFCPVFREVVDEIHARSSQDLSFGKNAAKAFRYVVLINQSINQTFKKTLCTTSKSQIESSEY